MNVSPVIAIVDDDTSLRDALASLLGSFDLRSEAFCSAQELLDSPRLADFSCILSDVVMPQANGFWLAERLRERGHRQPIIFMTAYKGHGYGARALAQDATCLLIKPFTTEALMRCITHALSSDGRPAP